MTAPETIAPPPDLSTKPKDIIGFCFGFSCPNHHIEHTFYSITMDRYGEQRVCQTCGEISTPAIVKRTAEARWEDVWPINICHGSHFCYTQRIPGTLTLTNNGEIMWTKYEFVKFLND
jgi:hypothetical protein